MKFYLALVVLCLFLPVLVADSHSSEQAAEEFRFKSIVIFGDSYSDNGNVYKLSNRAWPLSPPYYRGRYCNGLNWVDQLKVPGVSCYAYGGATTDNTIVQGFGGPQSIPVPGIRQQIQI